MKDQLESVLRKLDRKTLVNWVEEMRVGKPAYDFLLTRLRAGGLTRHQTANAMHALFRLRTHGSEEEVFSLIRGHARHPEIRVRNEAVTLLIGLVKLHNFQAPFQASTCINAIREAVALGLERDATKLAGEFLTRQGGSTGDSGVLP